MGVPRSSFPSDRSPLSLQPAPAVWTPPSPTCWRAACHSAPRAARTALTCPPQPPPRPQPRPAPRAPWQHLPRYGWGWCRGQSTVACVQDWPWCRGNEHFNLETKLPAGPLQSQRRSPGCASPDGCRAFCSSQPQSSSRSPPWSGTCPCRSGSERCMTTPGGEPACPVPRPQQSPAVRRAGVSPAPPPAPPLRGAGRRVSVRLLEAALWLPSCHGARGAGPRWDSSCWPGAGLSKKPRAALWRGPERWSRGARGGLCEVALTPGTARFALCGLAAGTARWPPVPVEFQSAGSERDRVPGLAGPARCLRPL